MKTGILSLCCATLFLPMLLVGQTLCVLGDDEKKGDAIRISSLTNEEAKRLLTTTTFGPDPVAKKPLIYEDAALTDVLKQMSKKTGVAFLPSKAVEDADYRINAKITQSINTRQLINIIKELTSVQFVLRDGLVRVYDLNENFGDSILSVYDISVVKAGPPKDYPAPTIDEMFGNGDEFGGASPYFEEESDFDSTAAVENLIQEIVDATGGEEAWTIGAIESSNDWGDWEDDEKPKASALGRISTMGDYLVVKTSKKVQEKVKLIVFTATR